MTNKLYGCSNSPQNEGWDLKALKSQLPQNSFIESDVRKEAAAKTQALGKQSNHLFDVDYKKEGMERQT